jgi:hypothetical protein
MKRSLTIATIIALSAAAYMPLSSVAQSSVSVVIGSAPPPPRFESVPASRNGHVWAPGYWNWNGKRHEWVTGHWERARDGYNWRPAEWRRGDRGYSLQQGGWVAVADRGYADVRIAPPAPRHEKPPRARRGYIWEPGHWDWRRGRYEWISGDWVKVRPGYAYRAHEWRQRDGRWYLEQPRWTRQGQGRDSDRDGVANRHDRDIDNDGVPNRRDADRDGDGVRNDRDRRPDNERRY